MIVTSIAGLSFTVSVEKKNDEQPTVKFRGIGHSISQEYYTMTILEIEDHGLQLEGSDDKTILSKDTVKEVKDYIKLHS